MNDYSKIIIRVVKKFFLPYKFNQMQPASPLISYPIHLNKIFAKRKFVKFLLNMHKCIKKCYTY